LASRSVTAEWWMLCAFERSSNRTRHLLVGSSPCHKSHLAAGISSA